MAERVTSELLLGEIHSFLRVRGMAQDRFSREAVGYAGLFANMAQSKHPRPATVAKVRAFIAEQLGQPAGQAIAETVAAEADAKGRRRMAARTTGGVKTPLVLTPAERVSTMMVEDVSDLVALVRRSWPRLWLQVIAAAREEGVMSGAMLVRTIEAGLAARSVSHG